MNLARATATVPDGPAADPRILQVDGVSLRYGDGRQAVTAVEDVSFSLAQGDRLALLGASGCGKSSLLKAVAGFLAPTAGRIVLDGRPVAGPGPDRAVVFQEFDQLLPWKTVLGNVAFALATGRGFGRRQAREHARAAIAMVGLGRVADHYPHALSGGMKQRVAIARALALEPRMLLMDEPFAALDAMTRRHMQEELIGLWERLNFTLLFVTHGIDEAVLVGDRVLLLSPHPGRVIEEVDTARFDRAGSAGADFTRTVEAIHHRLFPGSRPAP